MVNSWVFCLFCFCRGMFDGQAPEPHAAPLWPSWDLVWCQPAVPIYIWGRLQTLPRRSQHVHHPLVHGHLRWVAGVPNQTLPLGGRHQLWRREMVCQRQVCEQDRQEAFWCEFPAQAHTPLKFRIEHREAKMSDGTLNTPTLFSGREDRFFLQLIPCLVFFSFIP